MSLPVTNLDDRSFQDLVDEAKRLIPEFCPEWTNHNLSDPGVALIELFAWMTEMTLYRLNQVPDVFYTRMLNLLGFEQFPAAAARAELTFWLGGGGDVGTVVIPAGTQVATSGSTGDALVFTTIADSPITAPHVVEALRMTEGNEFERVWDKLSKSPEEVECFPRSVLPGECFYLGFDVSLAGNVVRLDVKAKTQGIGVVPDRPPLVWEVWEGADWIEAEIPRLPGERHVSDTTGGLNRDGTVLLLIPNAHRSHTVGDVGAFWLRARLLPAEYDRPAYATSPRLKEIAAVTVGGMVMAEHSDIVHQEYLGRSSGKPDQSYTVARTPVLPRIPGEVLEVITPTGTQNWEEVADFVDSGSTDRHFTLDSSTGEIRFGPLIRYPQQGELRQNGAVPPADAQLRMSSYRTGGGQAGNVGAGALAELRTAIPHVRSVVNLKSADGGVDAESVENAKRRGPLSVRAGGRAVTLSDFERLTMEADSRIGRVRCLAPLQQGGSIRLLIVPKIEEPSETLRLDHFALPEDMVEAIKTYLDDRRVLGTRIKVSTPYYQGVTVAALITARPGAKTFVGDRVKRVLNNYINPLAGGPDGGGWPFDQDLNAAHVFQLLESVEGVQKVEEVLFYEYDLRNEERLGFGKEMVNLEPRSLFLSSNHQVVVR